MTAGTGVRDRGRLTRGRLVDEAQALFSVRDRESVSVAEIARAARAHPNQVTYYFGGKDALYVEAVCRTFLQQTETVARAGAAARSPASYRRRVARAAMEQPCLPALAEALLLVRRRPELSGITGYTLDALFRQSADALSGVLRRRGWVTDRPVAEEVRRFWCAVLGAALFGAGAGGEAAAGAEAAALADTIGVRRGP